MIRLFNIPWDVLKGNIISRLRLTDLKNLRLSCERLRLHLDQEILLVVFPFRFVLNKIDIDAVASKQRDFGLKISSLQHIDTTLTAFPPLLTKIIYYDTSDDDQQTKNVLLLSVLSRVSSHSLTYLCVRGYNYGDAELSSLTFLVNLLVLKIGIKSFSTSYCNLLPRHLQSLSLTSAFKNSSLAYIKYLPSSITNLTLEHFISPRAATTVPSNLLRLKLVYDSIQNIVFSEGLKTLVVRQRLQDHFCKLDFPSSLEHLKVTHGKTAYGNCWIDAEIHKFTRLTHLTIGFPNPSSWQYNTEFPSSLRELHALNRILPDLFIGLDRVESLYTKHIRSKNIQQMTNLQHLLYRVSDESYTEAEMLRDCPTLKWVTRC